MGFGFSQISSYDTRKQTEPRESVTIIIILNIIMAVLFSYNITIKLIAQLAEKARVSRARYPCKTYLFLKNAIITIES